MRRAMVGRAAVRLAMAVDAMGRVTVKVGRVVVVVEVDVAGVGQARPLRRRTHTDSIHTDCFDT